MKRSPTMLIAGLLAVAGSAGCTVSTGVPGAPDINIEVAEPAVKQACRDFGRAFADATTADEMRNNMLPAAAAAAEAAQGDPDARAVADAMQLFLSSRSRSEAEVAMSDVMASCTKVGITMTWEE